MNNNCERCKSPNIGFNEEKRCFYCMECHAIWYQYHQEVAVSPKINIPDSPSDDNSSKDES